MKKINKLNVEIWIQFIFRNPEHLLSVKGIDQNNTNRNNNSTTSGTN